MILADQSWWFVTPVHKDDNLELIETAARTCYRSTPSGQDAGRALIRSLIKNGHESVIEHGHISIGIETDRGVTHELVRHRLASYSQESTRYCNYSKNMKTGEMRFIRPVWLEKDDVAYEDFIAICEACERYYLSLIDIYAWKAEQARQVLINAVASTIIITANYREWRHIFKLRCSPKAHPQIRALFLDIKKEFKSIIPVIFDDL